MVTAELVGSQAPSSSSVPPYVSSRGAEAIELCDSVGLDLDPWQRDVLIAGLGQREDGSWSAPEVGICMPRQCGKSSLLVARELVGLFVFGERLVIHSSYDASSSLEAFRLLLALLEDSELERQVKRISRVHGDEGIELVTGQRIRFRARTRSAGRGFSANLIVLVEAQLLAEAAMMPTQAARRLSQTWLAGTAVDQRAHDHGVAFARARERGRKGDQRLAWFEWSAGEMAEIDSTRAADRELWVIANPALGDRISVDHVERELAAMDHRSFCAERLAAGDWPDTSLAGGRVISADAWSACQDPRCRGGPCWRST
jgi:phage terminase large subunit-like protein